MPIGKLYDQTEKSRVYRARCLARIGRQPSKLEAVRSNRTGPAIILILQNERFVKASLAVPNPTLAEYREHS